MTRTRKPLVAVVAALLPIVLVIGLWFGGHPEDLPGFMRSAFVADHQTRVVDEVIQRIAHDYYRPVSTARLTNSSIAGVVASLGDRFSHYLDPAEFREFNMPPHFTGVGISVEGDRRNSTSLRKGLMIARVFDSSPAARAGLAQGELIVGVNGRPLAGLSAEMATALIKGLPGTAVVLQVERPAAHARPARARTLRITRATISEPVVESTTKVVGGVKLGVVELASFSPGAHGEVREAIEGLLHQGVKGIVLDLRGNGGGLVEEAQLVASVFIPEGVIVTTRGRTQPTQTLMALGGAIPTSIPVVVLVDSNTASSAEIVTAALQDHGRATVVGTHTFGKGVFQEEEGLSNGGALDITVGEYFTPNGRNLGGGGVRQGAGITPEIAVPHGVDTPHGVAVALAALAQKAK
jgi:carboxyl-terminal processing protease